VALSDDLERVAAVARGYARDGEELTGIVAAEPSAGARVYLCAFGDAEGRRTWLALDGAEEPVDDRSAVRNAVSISALCEVAVETAVGGDLEDLRSQLLALRLRENPPGIEEAEEAALELERIVGTPPRLATPAYLDVVGAATMRLERALGSNGASPFTEAMRGAMVAVESLAADVERHNKRRLA
jgi:hypothetical protein